MQGLRHVPRAVAGADDEIGIEAEDRLGSRGQIRRFGAAIAGLRTRVFCFRRLCTLYPVPCRAAIEPHNVLIPPTQLRVHSSSVAHNIRTAWAATHQAYSDITRDATSQ